MCAWCAIAFVCARACVRVRARVGSVPAKQCEPAPVRVHERASEGARLGRKYCHTPINSITSALSFSLSSTGAGMLTHTRCAHRTNAHASTPRATLYTRAHTYMIIHPQPKHIVYTGIHTHTHTNELHDQHVILQPLGHRGGDVGAHQPLQIPLLLLRL